MNKKLLEKKLKDYRFQLWPSAELLQLVEEAITVSHDPLIREMKTGWFSRLIRAALTCYIAYCKTMANAIEKQAQS